MTIPTSEPLPPEDRQNMPPARRRRQDHLAARHLPAAQAELVKALSYQATPTIGFYLFMALAGLVFAVAALLDAPALFILAALVAPFLGPVFGLVLAARVGSGRFFLKALIGVLVGFGLTFIGSLLGGFVARAFLPEALNGQAIFTHARLTIPDGILLSLGIILTDLSAGAQSPPAPAGGQCRPDLHPGAAGRCGGFWPGQRVALALPGWTGGLRCPPGLAGAARHVDAGSAGFATSAAGLVIPWVPPCCCWQWR